jgi:hypothetical protein
MALWQSIAGGLIADVFVFLAEIAHQTKIGAWSFIARCVRRGALVPRLLPAVKQQFPQYYGVIVHFVVCGEYQRDPTMLRKRTEPIDFTGVPPDFRLVTAAELLPTFGIMAEPLSQFRAGRNVLHPFIDRSVCLLHSTRP